MLENIIDLFNQVRTVGGWWTLGCAVLCRLVVSDSL